MFKLQTWWDMSEGLWVKQVVCVETKSIIIFSLPQEYRECFRIKYQFNDLLLTGALTLKSIFSDSCQHRRFSAVFNLESSLAWSGMLWNGSFLLWSVTIGCSIVNYICCGVLLLQTFFIQHVLNLLQQGIGWVRTKCWECPRNVPAPGQVDVWPSTP